MTTVINSPHLISRVLLEFRLRRAPSEAFFSEALPAALKVHWGGKEGGGSFEVQAKFAANDVREGEKAQVNY